MKKIWDKLDRDERAFFSIVFTTIVFNYFVFHFSLAWIFLEVCLFSVIYYLLYRSPLKKWSNLVKTMGGVGIVVLILGAALFIPKDSLWIHQGSEYVQATNSFYQIESSQIEERLKEQKKIIRYVYVGRESCPFCNAFAPKLKQAAKEAKASIYYIDTDNQSDELDNFAERYQVDSIPTLLVMKDGQLEKSVTDVSQLSVAELTEFLKTNKK